MGRDLLGIYHLLEDRIYVYVPENAAASAATHHRRLDCQRRAREFLGDRYRVASSPRSSWCAARPRPSTRQRYRAARQTPVFFGSAISNFGVEELLRAFVEHAPGPLPRADPQRSRSKPASPSSAASCSRSRPTWIRAIATASPSCACVRTLPARHAHHQVRLDKECASPMR
jgi:peptide subunit release factor RF-3